MPQIESAPAISGLQPGKKALLVFFETDCPTCQLALPYLNSLAQSSVQILGISQDDEESTRAFVQQLHISFPVEVDHGLKLSRSYDPQSVPAIFLLDSSGHLVRSITGFDKAGLNDLAAELGQPPIAPEHDGNPAWKPGCSSRHLEPESTSANGTGNPHFLRKTAEPATRITLDDKEDPFAYCMRHFGDALPVAPPTVERVQAMLAACNL